MRCNFVDLYHALYGIKRPQILCAPEMSAMTSGLPRIPKLSDKLRSVSPCETKPLEINTIESNSREASQLFKREPELNIEDDHYSMKEEQPEVIKVSFFIGSFIVQCICLLWKLIVFWFYRVITIFRMTTKLPAMLRLLFDRQMPRKWKPSFVRTIQCHCLESPAVLVLLASNRECSKMKTKTAVAATPNPNPTKINRLMANQR